VNKDQVDGRVEELKGTVKEVAGKLTGNQALKNEGSIEKLGGKVQAGLGDLKSDLKKGS
jgi:uncharacterized protein YjbJ (UPF0337 family)